MTTHSPVLDEPKHPSSAVLNVHSWAMMEMIVHGKICVIHGFMTTTSSGYIITIFLSKCTLLPCHHVYIARFLQSSISIFFIYSWLSFPHINDLSSKIMFHSEHPHLIWGNSFLPVYQAKSFGVNLDLPHFLTLHLWLFSKSSLYSTVFRI